MAAQGLVTSSSRQTAEQVVATVAMLAAFFGVYFVAGHADTRAWSTHLPIDDVIPLLPTSVWVYLSPYAVGLVVVALLPASIFRAFYVRACLIGALHALCFFAVPTSVARPALPASGGVSLALLRSIYALDSPLNAAPSAHVSITLLTTWAVLRARAAWRAPVALWAGAVIFSVLSTGQHHIIDVVTGALLFALVHAAVLRRERRAQGPNSSSIHGSHGASDGTFETVRDGASGSGSKSLASGDGLR